MWAAPAVLSLVASLFAFCGVPSDATDEIGLVLAIVGAIGLGFAISSYAIASALGEIALALASEVSNRGTVEAQVMDGEQDATKLGLMRWPEISTRVSSMLVVLVRFSQSGEVRNGFHMLVRVAIARPLRVLRHRVATQLRRARRRQMPFNKHDEGTCVSEAPAAPRMPIVPQPRFIIDARVRITGTIRSEGEIHVEGQIDGDICCAHLTVGRNAAIVGNITADEIVVCGQVKGIMRGNRIMLQDSARVESEVIHKMLAIEEGACFEGKSIVRRHASETLDQKLARLAGG